MNYFILACFLLSLRNDVVASTISWNTESVTVKQGDALNLTCTVSNVDAMNVIRVSFKNSEGQILAMSDNQYLKSPFSNDPRYSLEFHIITRVAYATISYKDIRGEEMGSLLCQKLDDSNNSAEVKVHVQVPVKEIYLSLRTSQSWKKLNEADEIVLREMQDNEVECVALMDGGLMPTELRIFIGTEDRTQFFTASEESKVIKSHENELGRYYSQFKLTYTTMIPSREFNGLRLTCVAAQDGFSNVSASAMMRVEYGPVIMCDKYEHHSKMNRTVNVVCEVAANPACHHITWSMDALGQAGSVRRTLTNDSSFQLTETPIDSDARDRVQVQLQIRKVGQMDFTFYYLSAVNEISSAEVTIVLLPASLKLSQLPSAQDQMMYFLRQQQQQLDPESALAMSSNTQISGSTGLQSFHTSMLLMTVILLHMTR